MKTKTILCIFFFMGMGLSQLFAQNLNKGGVIAFSTYTFTLKPGVTMDQLLDVYMNKYIPEVEKNYPGTKSYVLTGNRGEKKNQIAFVTYFESVAVRDKYYPVENDTAMSEAVKTAEMKLKPVNDELSKLILNSERVYTDWVIK